MADEIGIGIPSPPKLPATLDRATVQRAGDFGNLAALVIAGPRAEAEIDTLHFRIEQLHIELCLGFGLRAARARAVRR